jgi:hypothetical protein
MVLLSPVFPDKKERRSKSVIVACLFSRLSLVNEISRRTCLYVARNHSLPAQVHYQAQFQLNALGRYTRPMTVKNRCTATCVWSVSGK